ncbi:Dye-decolorizing peroxidase msp1 [Bienertia sinuspersici]
MSYSMILRKQNKRTNSLTISSSSVRFKCPFSYQIEITIDLKS